MNRCFYAGLGYVAEDEIVLLSIWEGTTESSEARFMKDGHFDVDQWESEQIHLCPRPGADIRAAWKEAWRILRLAARNAGCPWKLVD